MSFAATIVFDDIAAAASAAADVGSGYIGELRYTRAKISKFSMHENELCTSGSNTHNDDFSYYSVYRYHPKVRKKFNKDKKNI